MEKIPKGPSDEPYDLEERAFLFAQEIRLFIKQLSRTVGNLEDVKQVIRSSGSVGANYIEANESLGRKDFLMKIRTWRKESKESAYWLRLLNCSDGSALHIDRTHLVG